MTVSLNHLGKHLKTLSVVVTHTEGRSTQHGEVACLPKQYISGFLFGISAGRIKDPQLRAKVIQFQEEAHLFLDAAFTGDAESAMQAIRQLARNQMSQNEFDPGLRLPHYR